MRRVHVTIESELRLTGILGFLRKKVTKFGNGARIYQTLISAFHTIRPRGQDLLIHGPMLLRTSHGWPPVKNSRAS